MNYRFHEGSLSGHSFGNIFLAALEKVSGDFVHGISIASEILKVNGRVLPVTSNKADLVVELNNGTFLKGENELNHSVIESGIKRIYYKDNVVLNDHARKAITRADIIILGPGNYYCSIIPNLIVDGFKEALHESEAKIVLPVNLTNKHGHTMGWKASDYVNDIEGYLGKEVDIVLINNELPSKEQIEIYQLQEGDGVLVEDDYKNENVMREPLLSHAIVRKVEGDAVHSVRSFIRHDSEKLAEAVSKIIFPK